MTAHHAGTTRVTRGMVAAPHPTASQAGLEMLTAGGTAVDAAVAAAFALCVVTPASTGIAGFGGCMVAFLADRGGVVAVDFTSIAPQAARKDMYPVKEDGTGGFSVPGSVNAWGALAVDAPGMVAGLTHVQQQYGTLPLGTVLKPAIVAAAEGFSVDAWTAQKITETIVPNAQRFPDTVRLFSLDGRPPHPGEVLANRELAAVLERIGRHGADAFYRGDVARAIVETIQRAGGLLTMDDLAGYTVSDHTPAYVRYRGGMAYTPHLPTGGLTVLQMLRVIEGFEVSGLTDDAALAHLLVEVAKVCWRERLTRYGDPRHVPVDVDQELDDPLVERLRAEVAVGLASPGPGVVIAPDPLLVGTVHMCAADVRGNLVSMTHSHGGSFGSLLSVPGTGILLSHGMSRFDPRPGRANSIAPRKRPMHNMSPMLLLKNGRPLLAIGAAGGRTIQNNLCHAIARVVDLGASLETAITAPRFHIETAEPVHVEDGADALAAGLVDRGHRVNRRAPFGAMQAIQLDPHTGEMTGVADPRRAGTTLWT